MSREIKAKAWNGESFYSPVLYDGKVFRDARALEDFIPCDDPVVWYTGLKDKNGVEIYESDVVRCNNGHVGLVEWEQHDCCFNVSDYYCSSNDYTTMAFIEGQPFEVIGNIYETPELLENK